MTRKDELKSDVRYRMSKKTYVFHTDPGHGWLAVRKSELIALDVLERITPYSYMKGDTVYLEEDCDAATFMQAYQEKVGKELLYRSSYQEKTPIRYYENFSF